MGLNDVLDVGPEGPSRPMSSLKGVLHQYGKEFNNVKLTFNKRNLGNVESQSQFTVLCFWYLSLLP